MRIHRTMTRALLCLVTSCLSLSAFAQNQSTSPMGTPGQFAVSPSGAATYRIPIQVPPGVAGMEPKLELVYNSQSGNGMLGMGWGLSGLSTITRCSRTQAQDGVRGGVNFDGNDRFCLDGQRLMVVSGNYGAAGSEYRTEIDSFSKITAVGAAGNGPASFLIKTKSGLTMELGNSVNSRIEAVKAASGTSAWPVGTVRAWAQNKLSDIKGNYLTVTYDEDAVNGSYLPSRIDYTGNASAVPALVPEFSVNFVRSVADRADVLVANRAGSTIKSTKRITNIQTKVGADLVKDYQLVYATQASALDRSQLSTLTECDGGVQPVICLPAISVQWDAKGTDGFAPSSSWLNSQFVPAQGWTDANTFPRHLVDVNGDGFTDIVGFSASGVYVALSNGAGFTTASHWLSNQFATAQGWTDANTYPRQLVDVNGDGLADVVGFSSTGVYIALNNGGGFEPPSYWLNGQFGTTQGWINNTLNPRQLVDVNGDGLPDVVGFAAGGVTVALNTGGGFEIASTLAANYTCSNGGTLVGGSCMVAATPVMGCPSGTPYWDGDFNMVCSLNSSTRVPQSVVGFTCASGSLQGSACSTPANYSCPSGYTVSGSNCSLATTGGTASGAWSLAQFGQAQGWIDSSTQPRQVIDVNGDGLPDIVGFGSAGVMVSLNTGSGFAAPTNWVAYYGTAAGGWTDTNTYPRMLVDVNGDGLPDVVGFSSIGVMVSINTGTSFMAAENRNAYFGTAAGGWSDNNTYPRTLVDVNSDGLPDIVGFAGGGVMVALNKGSTFDTATNWNAYFGTAAGGWSNNNTYPRMMADVNGDGLPDVVGFSGTAVMVALDNRKATASYVTSISNGVGEAISYAYAPLTNSSVYTRDTGANKAVAPQVDLTIPAYVVNQTDSSNGIGGTSKTAYTYGGLKTERGTGRGMLGFRWVNSKNLEFSLDNYTEYRQDFPYTGASALSEVRQMGSGYGGVLKRKTATYQCTDPLTVAACSVAPGKRYFIYPASTNDQAWDTNGSAMGNSTTVASYGANSNGQFYGDLAQTTLTTMDGASKVAKFTYLTADTDKWYLGRVLSNVSTSSNATGTRVRETNYDYVDGLLLTEIVEPNSPSDCLKKTFTYDGFGNRSSVKSSVCPSATGYTVLSATPERINSDNFGANGRFPITSTNALNQSETKVYDNRYGGLTTLTGPNGLTTGWQYDSFGRKVRENRADGTYTTWTYQFCSGSGANCPSSVGVANPIWVLTEQSFAFNGAINAPQKRQYFDRLNRVIRVQTQGFDGAGVAAPALLQDVEYNLQGLVWHRSNTYASTSTPIWSTYFFDSIGRTTSEYRPNSANVGDNDSTVYSLNGLSSSATNAKGQTKTTVKNAQGQVASVTDTQGNTVSYTYDALGNLTQTNAAGSITAMQYNLRGQKIAMQDPSMGSWVYRYNAFGEMVSQRDSLNQTTTLDYDVLGRLIKRTEPDLVSEWSFDKKFDGTSCGKGIGKVCEAKANNSYKRTHTYDSLGRNNTTATILDNVASPAVVSETFNANTGRVASKTWPTGYTATYEYTTLGYLSSVKGGNGLNGFAGIQKYQVLGMNEAGQITQYRTGDNVTMVSTYDLYTQRLSALLATRDGQATGNVLAQTYTYDQMGNLLLRADSSPGVGTNESFSYDSLNRLTTSIITGGAVSQPETTEVMYDQRGNIAYKSDVGRYWYDPARPNRMTNVTLEAAPGANALFKGTRSLSYAFDDYSAGVQSLGSTTVGNGNLQYTVSHDATSGRHTVRYESYTSFNMPKELILSSFASNATTCLPGYTLSAGQCTLTTTTTNSATEVYSCSGGGQAYGSTCVVNVSYSYSCGGGWMPQTCNGNYTYTYPSTVTYVCPTGTLSGTLCIVTSTISVPPGTSNPADRTLTYLYGPEHQRIKENVALSGTGTSSYFSGNTWYLNGEDSLGLSYEKEVRANGTTEHKHYLTAQGFTFGVFTSRTGTLNGLPATSTSYFHKDHLGSIAAITDETGAVTERLAYDPWGKRRYVNTTPGLSDKLDAITGIKTDRGYTEHQHLDEVGVVHMNGRIYDPLIGRFMSADPHVTNPYDLRSFNRYSYVYNNPLKFTDSTGYDIDADNSDRDDAGVYGSGDGYSWHPSSGGSTRLDESGTPVLSWTPGVQVAVGPLYIGAMGSGGALGLGAGGITLCDCGSLDPGLRVDPRTDIPSLGKTPVQSNLSGIPGLVFEAVRAGREAVLQSLGVTKSESSEGADNADKPAGPTQPNENNLDKIKGNKAADAAAREADYKDAHDAKWGRGNSGVDIYNDKTTGEKYLWDGKKGSNKDPL